MARPASRPLDDILRARLHLAPEARFGLNLVRGGLNVTDSLSRTFLRQPFFALRETENLLRDLQGRTGDALITDLLARNGGTSITATGLGNIPRQGPVIIASTHPTGLFDFLAHAAALGPVRPDMKVVANDETEVFLGADKIIPVKISKTNQAESGRATHAAMCQHLDAGGALLIFGSGRVPYRSSGKLVEPDWRSGTTRVSARCNAPIVPAALNARNSRYYYTLRKYARYFSRRNDNFGALVGSLRYAAELLEKLGGACDVHYGARQLPGTDPVRLKQEAEALVAGLYAPAAKKLAPPD